MKKLWEDPAYRESMSKAHMGGIPWNKGKRGVQIDSEETRQKKRSALLGKKRPPFSEEWKEKISASKKGKPNFSRRGAGNPCWKGGTTPEEKRIRRSLEARLWREAVFARDNFTCQKCKERGGSLRAHHILNWARNPEVRFAIDNGITLCNPCHILFHHVHGKRDNNRGQLVEFLGGVE